MLAAYQSVAPVLQGGATLGACQASEAFRIGRHDVRRDTPS